MNTLEIEQWKLAGFMLVLVIPIAINYRFKLQLFKPMIWSISRMTIQLIFVGLYLEFLFKLDSLWVNIAWLAVMLLIGSSAIVNNTKLPLKYLFMPVLCGLTVGLIPLLLLLLLGLLQPSPIYSAQYMIPLAGMLLGNSMTGNIIALQHLFGALDKQQNEFEAALALGATPKQAVFEFVQQAIQRSINPILASMATTGLVTLPGMMTGQILGGSNPMLAIKYQLVIMVAVLVMLSLSVITSLSTCTTQVFFPTGKLKFRLN